MSTSLWQRRHHDIPDCAQAVVIGAGIAGISAALALEARGVQPLILDQHHSGWGASGRNAGFLMRGAADNYTAATRTLGRDNAKLLWQLTESNLARLRSLGVARLPHYRDQPSCLVAFNQAEADEIETSIRLMREDGFDTHAPDDSQTTDALWTNARPLIAQVNPHDAVCDPVELLAWLRSKLASRPVRQATVRSIEPAPSGAIVHTNHATIHTDRVLVCTNAYTGSLLPDLARHIEPNRGQMLALDATSLPAAQRLTFAYYANHGSEYFRQVDDATVIVGGWRKHHAQDERTLDNHPSDPVQQGLERFSERILGRPLPVTHRWAGTMGFTPDQLPLAGPIAPPNTTSTPESPIWICAGFTGHGMSLAHEIATRTAEAILGADSLPDIFSPHRFQSPAKA